MQGPNAKYFSFFLSDLLIIIYAIIPKQEESKTKKGIAMTPNQAPKAAISLKSPCPIPSIFLKTLNIQ